MQDIELFYISDAENIPLISLKLFETDFLFSFNSAGTQTDFYANIPF